ncbi:MAG: hypothetical protein Q7S66_00850 [bacterium]|nr:hypothetical protein [bacterium]
MGEKPEWEVNPDDLQSSANTATKVFEPTEEDDLVELLSILEEEKLEKTARRENKMDDPMGEYNEKIKLAQTAVDDLLGKIVESYKINNQPEIDNLLQQLTTLVKKYGGAIQAGLHALKNLSYENQIAAVPEDKRYLYEPGEMIRRKFPFLSQTGDMRATDYNVSIDNFQQLLERFGDKKE